MEKKKRARCLAISFHPHELLLTEIDSISMHDVILDSQFLGRTQEYKDFPPNTRQY